MKIAVLTANMGGFENVQEHVPQSIEYDLHRFTDENFPPRRCTMTPRMQARMAKMFGWQMRPGYDFYLWVDSSCILSKPDSLEWFVNQGRGVDLVTFKHPHRDTIQQEADYLKERLQKGCPYITERYENELIDEQLQEILGDKNYIDNRLFASTVMGYSLSDKMQGMLEEWWYHCSRYHSDEQLSLPYVADNFACKVNAIPENYMKMPYLQFIRNKK